jgi:hypothetical protein
MALAGKGAVIVWNDIAPELREEFFEWHPRQHMPERLGLPGFLRGRRCIAIDSTVEWLTLYEVRGLDVLDSDIYRTRLANPTEWSLKVMPGFRNNVRGGCRVEFTGGPVMGGFIQTIRVETDAGRRPSLIEALQRELPRVLERPRVLGAHLLVNDPGLSGGQVGARQGRVITQPDVVIVLEGSTVDGVRAIADSAFDDPALTALGAKPSIIRDLFQLEYSLQAIEGVDRVAPSTATGFATR